MLTVTMRSEGVSKRTALPSDSVHPIECSPRRNHTLPSLWAKRGVGESQYTMQCLAVLDSWATATTCSCTWSWAGQAESASRG